MSDDKNTSALEERRLVLEELKAQHEYQLRAVNAARIFLRTAEVKFPSFADLGVALMSPFLADGLGVSGLARVSAGR